MANQLFGMFLVYYFVAVGIATMVYGNAGFGKVNAFLGRHAGRVARWALRHLGRQLRRLVVWVAREFWRFLRWAWARNPQAVVYTTAALVVALTIVYVFGRLS